MRQFLQLSVFLLVLSTLCPAFAQTPEDEKIAKSLYLKASKAIRAEEYQEAVELLTQILDEYPESEVVLMADEKLSEIADKAALGSLPKTPGFYFVEMNDEITEMPQKMLQEGAPYEYGSKWAPIAYEQVPSIFADELKKFIVYRPKGTLQDVAWTAFVPIMTYDADENLVPSGNFKQLLDWSVMSVEGDPFGADKVVFDEIKPGMWEVGFPTVFSPTVPVVYGLVDGSGKAGLVLVQSRMVHAFYPYLEFWEKAKIDSALNIILKQKAKHPENVDIQFFEAVMKYKLAYKQDRPQTEALELARAALKRAQTSDVTPKVLTDLYVLEEYCVADSLVRANCILPEDSAEVMAKKNAALQSYTSDKVPTGVIWFQEQVVRNHAFCGEYSEATILAEQIVKAFKEQRPDTGGWSLGGLVKVEVEFSGAKPDVPDAFDIHDALTCYTIKAEWERIKDLKKEMESEQYLGQAAELIAAGAEPKKIEKALKNAKGKNKNNIRCYNAMIEFYTGIGKPKDAEKARKDIKKAEERITKLEMSRESS